MARQYTRKNSFGGILKELQALHDKKGADYGSEDDSLANIRAAADFNVDPWQYGVIRISDNIHRLRTFFRVGKLENESVEETLKDIAVFAVIALQLLREEE